MAPDQCASRTAAAAAAISLGSLLCAALHANTPDANPAHEPLHATIEAIADQEDVGPASIFQVAVVQHIRPGWHTYWINPGDAGQATKLNWSLPTGYRIDDVEWPVAKVFRSGPLVSYGYEGTVVLLQDVHAPVAATPQPVTLLVEAHWLVCQDICIPEEARAQVVLRQVATQAQAPASSPPALFKAAREQLPKASPWRASLAVSPTKAILTLHGLAHELTSSSDLHFLPLTWGQIDNAAAQQVQRSGADILLTLTRGDLRAAPLEELAGVLVLAPGSSASKAQGFQLDVTAADSTPARRN